MAPSVTLFLVLTVVCLLQSVSLQNDMTVTEFAELKEVRHLSQSLQMLNTTMLKEKKEPVMFYAVIREKTFTYNIDTILVFETVIVNEGGLYNKYDDVFVAPRKGTYMFSWTVSGTGTTYTVTELVVENQVISSAGEYHGGAGHSSGSMTALCDMSKGDHAWIRSTGASTAHNLYSHDNYPQSSFLGFLLLTE
ncbi:cerebellin-1-like [Mytilus californianus]|uniref:cerebellin-1-like n=1 Tax=Mytilus californianus TaxID=6549 RepID=UPI002248364D|nr:cerebellin-1-like [Mytilus californianus]